MHVLEAAPDAEANIPSTRYSIKELCLSLPDACNLFSFRLFNTNAIPIKIFEEASMLYDGDELTDSLKIDIVLTPFDENDSIPCILCGFAFFVAQ